MRHFQTLGLLAIVSIALGSLRGDNSEQVIAKVPFDVHKAKGRAGGGGTPTILYNGGPVLNQANVPIYVIYYGTGIGTGFPPTTENIINSFLEGLGGTPEFNVNTTYCDTNTTTCPGSGTSISGLLAYPIDLSHLFLDPGSQGASIGSNAIPRILQNAIKPTGSLPADNGAIYVLITAPTVKVSGFCTSFCAYHTRSTGIISGHTIHYALAPEPGSKCTACDGNFAFGQSTTPNGDPGADEVVDSLEHELSETVTDPDLNAWFTSNGSENGDLCNYNYGDFNSLPKTTNTGASYNASWGKYFYLIQLIWKNGTAPGCAAAP